MYLSGGLWPAEPVALGVVAAFTDHEFELRRTLDAFGHYFQAEATAENDDRLADRALFVLVRNAGDEALVEL